MTNTPTRELKPGERIFFKHDGEDFSAIRQARVRCEENGYSYGSMARDMRIGIKKGDYLIAKRYNLDKEDIETLDGYINCDNKGFRNGNVGIVLFTS